MDAAERIARERDFHNQRFAEESSEREVRARRFYDAIAYGFDEFHARARELAPAKHVLEYGCGDEILAYDLANTARQVTGIDISDVAIVQAERIARQRNLDNVKFHVDNAEDMHIADGSIDVVIGAGIIHHLDIPRAVKELRRVLGPDGVAVFAEPLGHNPVLNWYRNRTPELRTPDEHPLLIRDLRYMAREFSSSHVTYFGLVAPVLGFLTRDVRRERLLTRIVWGLDRMLCRIPLLRRYAWYCYFELRV